ncbi:MAG: sce7725 family protein [Prolixibacteraceae bacterium]|nr:sce7725 family protein [Prolixibacteraceae bacterium]
MYFPYLRARQFELITLRDLAGEGALQGKITPVIEPVKESFNNLNLAHKIFLENDYYLYLIVNPFEGDVAGDNNYFLDYISGLEDSKYFPAFHYSDNSDYINSKMEEYELQDCMLICLDNFSNEEGFKNLCQNPKVSHIMLLEPNKYRSLDRFIKGLEKFYIRLDDPFEKQQKNADFLKIAEHKFTEEHLFYSEDRYNGFADFTVLPREYSDGGSTPRAVVVHLTYLDEQKDRQIWIRHFTSETNDSISNVQGKFAEAAEKAIKFCDKLQLDNSAIAELRNYYISHKYPGLGTVKKISIKNHLLMVSNFLD